MSGTVHFMAVAKIRSFFIWFCNDKISIEIAVWLLYPSDQIDDPIGSFFQLRIRADGQRIRHGFQPFCKVTVLKDPSVIGAAGFTGCNPEIADDMAWADIWDLIMQYLFLIRKHGMNDRILDR